MKKSKHRFAAYEACIMTNSGRYFFFERPESGIHLEDIAHALSHLCRYNGHSRKMYSVAQHSVHVSELVKAEASRRGMSHQKTLELAKWGLLHDASEAYLGDVTSPLKKLLAEYKRLEKKTMHAVCKHFFLPVKQPDLVKWADLALLAAERRDIMPKAYVLDEDHWGELKAPPPGLTIIPWSPAHAKATFLHVYQELCV